MNTVINTIKIIISDGPKNKRLKQTFLSFTRGKSASQVPIHQAPVLPTQTVTRPGPFHMFSLSPETSARRNLGYKEVNQNATHLSSD